MNLHRAGAVPDWELATDDLNYWQRLAARTGGKVTPANIITIAGFVLILAGLGAVFTETYRLGLILLVLGRACDLLDGYIAAKTGTSSPFGEKLDAGVDKVGTLIILIGLLAAGVITWRIALLLAIPQVLIFFVSALAYRRGAALHPSRSGKISMALLWLCLISFVALYELSGTGLDTGRIIAGGLLAASISVTSFAFLGYLDEYQAAINTRAK